MNEYVYLAFLFSGLGHFLCPNLAQVGLIEGIWTASAAAPALYWCRGNYVQREHNVL